jgi:hypothetical protein
MFIVQPCLLALQQPNYGCKSTYADGCMLLELLLQHSATNFDFPWGIQHDPVTAHTYTMYQQAPHYY